MTGAPLRGGVVELAADTSSQFASGLLLAAPVMAEPLQIRLRGRVVSRPYLDLTVSVMRRFGAAVTDVADGWDVVPSGYRATDIAVEPDASAASYFFAAAAITGGRVRVEGLGSRSGQGDLRFVDVLAEMGATVSVSTDAVEVSGGPLRGVDVDMSQISDTAQTLAVVAAFADGPTTVSGIGFIRAKETDRVGAVVTELRRCGVDAEELDDGFRIRPPSGGPRGAEVATYGDHRMAMSFALLGLRVPGIVIADPGCVAKTFPDFFDVLDELRADPQPAG